MLFVATAGSISSRAQIVFHDIIPDSSVSGSSSGLYSIKPASGDPEIVIRYFPSPVSVTAEQHGTLELLFQDGFPAKLNLNDNISATSTSWIQAGVALNSGGSGNWQSESTDKHLAFRFKIAGTWRYGWLKMTVAPGGAGFTVKEWAYQAQAGQSILAGQKSTTNIDNISGDKEIGLLMTGKNIGFSNLQQGRQYLIIITGTDGRSLLRSIIAATDITDVTGLPTGMYAVQLFDRERQYRFKLFLTR